PSMRGGADAPPGASRRTWLLHPPFWALRPKPRGRFMQGHSPCTHLFGRSAPSPGLLSRVEKVGKDTPGTSWFLDLRHKGEDPLGFPRLLPRRDGGGGTRVGGVL